MFPHDQPGSLSDCVTAWRWLSCTPQLNAFLLWALLCMALCELDYTLFTPGIPVTSNQQCLHLLQLGSKAV